MLAIMAQREYTDYQKKIIDRYYQHLDAISLAKLQELASDLYLAQTQAEKKRLWQRVKKAMDKLKIPAAIADHIIASQDPQVLARHLEQWLAKK